MGQPAARLGDMHTCPLSNGDSPHVGGPVLPACMPTVLIGGIPAARVGDLAYCNAPPDVIVQGSATVLIGGRMAARLGDMTAHGGVIVVGDPTVLIGDGSDSQSGASESQSGGILTSLSNMASSIEGFETGVVEGAWDGIAGMAKGIGHLAVSGYKLTTDSQYRTQTVDAAIRRAEAAGDYGAKEIEHPGQALGDIGNAAGGAWDKLKSGYEQAATKGQGSEFIGKAFGQGAVLVGGALIPGGAEADAAGVAGDAGRAAELAGDAAKASDVASDASLGSQIGDRVIFTTGAKIDRQMVSRGWTQDSVNDTLLQPYTTRPAFNRATGNAATAFFKKDGSYVIRDNDTNTIVQISNRHDPTWMPDSSIQNAYRP